MLVGVTSMLMVSLVLTAVAGLLFQCFRSIDVCLVSCILTGSSLSSSSSSSSSESSSSSPLSGSEELELPCVPELFLSSSLEATFDLHHLFDLLWSFLCFWCVFSAFLSFFSVCRFCLHLSPAISKGFGGKALLGDELMPALEGPAILLLGESMSAPEGPAILFPSPVKFSGEVCVHCSSMAIVY